MMSHVRRLVKEQLDQFTGAAFQAICRECVWRLHRTGELGFTPQRVGSWWDRQQQVDVVAVGEEKLLVGECKLRARPVGTNVLDDLKRKARLLIQHGNWTRVQYALFSRAGFTPALKARAKKEGTQLVDLKRLVAPPR